MAYLTNKMTSHGGGCVMGCGDAIFRHFKTETLANSEDSDDQALVSDVPVFLLTHALRRAGGSMFAHPNDPSQQDAAGPVRPVQINIVRDGKIRTSVPVKLQV